jgi:predicted GTPase
MPMPHTDEEIERAAERFEKLAEELDPEAATVHLVREPLPRPVP